MTTGWLTGQLPGVMGGDRVVGAFAAAAEEVGDSFRARSDDVEHQLDAHLASVDMLSYLAGWLGFPLDQHDGAEFNRTVLPVVARTLRNRATAAALRDLLEVLTGGSVEIDDPGGVYGPNDSVPPQASVVGIRLSSVGALGRTRLSAIVQRELPAGVTVDVTWPDPVAAEGH